MGQEKNLQRERMRPDTVPFELRLKREGQFRDICQAWMEPAGNQRSEAALQQNGPEEKQAPVSLGKALLRLQNHPPLFVSSAKFRMIMSKNN